MRRKSLSGIESVAVSPLEMAFQDVWERLNGLGRMYKSQLKAGRICCDKISFLMDCLGAPALTCFILGSKNIDAGDSLSFAGSRGKEMSQTNVPSSQNELGFLRTHHNTA